MSRKVMTAIIAIVLLAAIAGANYLLQMDPTQLAARGVGKDPHSHGEDQHDGEHEPPSRASLTEPIGPEDAEVTVTLVYGEQPTLEGIFRPMSELMAQDYGDHLRVEFVEAFSERGRKLMEEKSKGMHTFALINGKMAVKVPKAPLGMLAFSGSPQFEEWTEQDLRMAVEAELDRAGVDYTPAKPRRPTPPPGHEGHQH